MDILFFMVTGGLAVGVVYAAVKLWGDVAAGRQELGPGRVALLAALAALLFVAAFLGLAWY